MVLPGFGMNVAGDHPRRFLVDISPHVDAKKGPPIKNHTNSLKLHVSTLNESRA